MHILHRLYIKVGASSAVFILLNTMHFCTL